MDPSQTHAFARFARWSERVVASPFFAVGVLLVILLALFVLPPLGVDEDRVRPIEFGVAVVTLLLVFLIEHNEQRDTTAIHVKLDEILLALHAGHDKIGVEELPVEKIEDARDEERAKAARR